MTVALPHPLARPGRPDPRWRMLSPGVRVCTAAMLVFAMMAMMGCATIRHLVGPFAPSREQVGICTWMGCKQGAVSFSVDDGRTICREEMERAGFRGTYYYDGASTEPWFAAYSASGHEVGSHLRDHVKNCTRPPKGFPNLTAETLKKTPYTDEEVRAFRRDQIEPNIAAIEAGTGMPVLSMAWPCGSTDAGRMAAAAYYFLGSRGNHDPWDSNLTWVQDVNAATPAEFQNLNAANHYDQTFVDRAASEGTWAIVTSHEVCEGIGYIGSRRDALWVAPVRDVLKYILVRNAVQFDTFSRSRDVISFDVIHTMRLFQRQTVDGTRLAPIEFDNPVTVKVRLEDAAEVSGVQVDGAGVSYTVTDTPEGLRFVLFDASLNVRRHVRVMLQTRQAVRGRPAGAPPASSFGGTVPRVAGIV